jgi:hypothetical protein
MSKVGLMTQGTKFLKETGNTLSSGFQSPQSSSQPTQQMFANAKESATAKLKLKDPSKVQDAVK